MRVRVHEFVWVSWNIEMPHTIPFDCRIIIIDGIQKNKSQWRIRICATVRVLVFYLHQLLWFHTLNFMGNSLEKQLIQSEYRYRYRCVFCAIENIFIEILYFPNDKSHSIRGLLWNHICFTILGRTYNVINWYRPLRKKEFQSNHISTSIRRAFFIITLKSP